ncbi:hypothetical protein XM52_17510 [Roseovarius indicus]|uniref:Uncharacterized protein n=2 Tax=Roseovarius indicus TaxID=540747 RepID=A0A0T5P6Q3_9RHOB|nr:hypothetical protein [Roseovarius indicus]KRS16689.1 hypothetical protein XM52_17510 [Roseovarius indicus]
MRNNAFVSEPPAAHHLIVDVRPQSCFLLYGVLSGHPEDTSGATPTAGSLMVIKCYKVKMRVPDIVSGLVMDGEDKPSFALCEFFSKASGQLNPLGL